MKIKITKLVELNNSTVTVFLNKQIFKYDLIEFKCLCCNKNCKQKFDEKLKERFFHTFKFSKHGNNKRILFLQKDFYPCEYMGDWANFNKNLLSENKDFIVA